MNELVKPKLKVDLDIKLPELMPVTHNLNIIEDYAVNLKKYYSSLAFTDSQYKEAKEEKAKVNNLVKKIKEIRIETVNKYKEPIDDFEKTSKKIEKLLGESSDLINESIKKFDEQEAKAKQLKIKGIENTIFNELSLEYPEYVDKLNSFTVYPNDKWYNKTYKLSDIEDDIRTQYVEYIDDLDTMNKEIDIIKKVTTNEIYIERYKHTRNLGQVLDDIEKDKELESKKELTKVIQVDPFAGLSVNNRNVKPIPILPHRLLCMASEEQLKQVIDFAKSIGITKIEIEEI